MPTCRRAVEQYFARDLRGWSGLAPDCGADDALAGFGAHLTSIAVRLGTADVEYQTTSVVTAGMNEPVIAHIRDGQLVLLRTEYWSFDSFECAALLESLGEPSERADLVWRERLVADGEWLYSDRGLALGVLPETSLIVTASAYVPTPATDYVASFARVRPERGVAAPAG
jgi:hypothetical protein